MSAALIEQIPFPVSWSPSLTSADILTCRAERPPGGMRSVCFQTPPEHHSPDKQTQTIAQHFMVGDFLHISISVWKPFSFAAALTVACLLQWSHEDRNNSSCRPSIITCFLAKGGCFSPVPSYLVGPSTEVTISMRHQVLSPAQTFIFPLFWSKDEGLQDCLLRQQVRALIKLI